MQIHCEEKTELCNDFLSLNVANNSIESADIDFLCD